MTRRAGGLALVTLVLACSDPAPGEPDGAPPPPDAGPTRSYALASTGAQLVIQPAPAIILGAADLATDVDAVVVHQEFYGLPWDAFEAGAAPPAAWVAIMDGLAADAAAIGPVFLSLQLVSGDGRRHLADRAVVTPGGIQTEAGWSAPCYDFATAPDGAAKRAAYVAYVDWMVRRFQPRWVNVAIELNLYAMACPDAAWNALVEVERAAYDAAKAALPGVVAFPSIQIDVLHGYGPDCTSPDRDACFDASYAKLANVARDRFAVTTFPYLVPALRDQGAIPAGWLTRAGDRGGEATIVAETGWLATPMVVQRGAECIAAIPSSEADQVAWFDRVIAEAAARELEVVTWVANRDLVPAELMTDCPCDYDASWCGFLDAFRQSAGTSPDAQAGAEFALKRFGSMGLRHHDGAMRAPLHARWEAARALPWSGAD
jgi:hypothetical protein